VNAARPVGRPPRSPAERVRARLRSEFGSAVADRLPAGYQRLGSVLLVRLPPGLEAAHRALGEAWCHELGVRTVLVRTGAITGEFRRPAVVRIAGPSGETEFWEDGIRYRLDAERIMVAEGNRTERRRFGRLVRPGETVVDLFAGIGYFALPALVHGRAARVLAVEKNPLAFRYLEENLERNGVAARARAWLGDNREVDLPTGVADRVVLGYLPTTLPWVPRALELLRPAGGTVHVHLVVRSRGGPSEAAAEVREAVARAGADVRSVAAREVKPYGPGRAHAVVDVDVGPPRSGT